MANLTTGQMKGKLLSNETLKGKLVDKGELSGFVNVGGGGSVVEIYDGEYDVTPDFTKQKLLTKQKMMEKDVTVQQIPVFEVSNEAGGTTVYIGKETEISYG